MRPTPTTRRQNSKVPRLPRIRTLLLIGHPVDNLHDHPLARRIAVEPKELVALTAVVPGGDCEAISEVVGDGDREVSVAHVGTAVVAARGDVSRVAERLVVYVAGGDEAAGREGLCFSGR